MNSKDLKNISKLAGISMSDAEMCDLEADMIKICAMADSLASLELDAQSPQPDNHIQILRSDKQVPYNDTQKLMASAPSLEDGYISVPCTIREEA